MAHTTNKYTGGFTLVEVMVGVGIFSVTMMSVFMVLSQSILVFSHVRNVNRISQTMQYQMESIRGARWDELMNKIGKQIITVDEYGTPTDSNGQVPFDWKAFKMEQTITLEKTDHYLVELTVLWTDQEGDSNDRVMKTWISKEGLNDYYTQSTN